MHVPFLLVTGWLGLWLGMPNAVLHIPIAVLFYPAALFLLACTAVREGGGLRAFRLGWLCGLGGASACLYWVAIPVHEVGGLPWPLAVPCVLVIGAYVGLYGGLFALLACRLLLPLPKPVTPWRRALLLGLCWYLLEWFRGWFCTGFPWLSLASGLVPWPVLTQTVSIVGAYGLSGLLVGLVCLALESTGKTCRPLRPAAFAAVALVLLVAFGVWRLEADRMSGSNPEEQDASPVFALIQGNVDQNVKWNPAMQEATLRRYFDLSNHKEGAPQADLVIWPETAMPFDYQRASLTFPGRIRAFVAERESALLFGAPAFRRRVPDQADKQGQPWEVFNRAYLVSASGCDAGWYEKEHLVPFGEYMPPWLDLPFLRPLLQGVGNFSPGEKCRPLPVPMSLRSISPLSSLSVNTGDGDAQRNRNMDRKEEGLPALVLGVLICYETIFPELARQRVADGATVLVNISNDAWFGRSAAAEQHLHLGLLRAVEQGRWLARATNTGISAFVDPAGRIVASGNLFTAESVIHSIRPLDEHTIFFHLAPWLPLLALGAVGGIVFSFLRIRTCTSSPI